MTKVRSRVGIQVGGMGFEDKGETNRIEGGK